MQFPKRDEATTKFFEKVVPVGPAVKIRPMFGHKAAFVNGNMFAGTFGTQVVVRLDTAARESVLKEEGASTFEPVKGRKMREYVVLPDSWTKDSDRVRRLMAGSLRWASTLPPKAGRKS